MSSTPSRASEERKEKNETKKPRRERKRGSKSMVMPSNVDVALSLSSPSCPPSLAHLAVLDDLVDGLGDRGLDVSDGDGHRLAF